MKTVFGGLATAMTVGAMPVYAAKVNDNLQVNGKVFADYQAVKNGTGDGFDFTRAYFEVRYASDADNMVRITLDQKTPDASTGKDVFVKYAYWQHKFNDNATIKVGQNHTPLVDYLQSEMWGHRYVYKTFTDAVGAETSSDLGLSVLGQAGDMVDYYVSYMNGEGYTHEQFGEDRSLMGRVEWHSGGVHVGAYAHSEKKRDNTPNYDPSRQVVYAWWQNDQFQVGGQYLKADDGSSSSAKFDNGKGYNILANVKLPLMGKQTKLFARYDTIDKLDDGTDAKTIIAGVEFEVAPGVKLAPNYITEDSGVSGSKKVKTIGINGQFKF
jgi:hypothetical protein